MNFTKIKETCLYVTNLEKAKEFYHEKLGLPIIDYQMNKHLFLRVGQSVLLCFNPNDSKNKKSPPSHFAYGKQHFAFEVNSHDYEALKQQIKTKNVVIIDQIIWPSGKESFYFEDLEGNVLEVVPDSGIWD